MTTFAFNVKVNSPFADVTDAALGAAASEGWGSNDIGKPVKLNALNAYQLATDGDSIEGFLVAIEPITVNDGFSFGSVQRNCRVEAELATGETGVTVGEYAVAYTQSAVGTAGTAKVKAEGTPGTEDVFNWRIIRLFTDGEAGSKVLLERV
jgi:hypothetical protein